MNVIADEVKVGDRIWGRTVSKVTQDVGDTLIMFEFEGGGLIHVSQNRVIEDYQRQPDKNLAGAVARLKRDRQWLVVHGHADNTRDLYQQSTDIQIVLDALEETQERSSVASWRADYDRTMNPEQGRDGWL